MGTWRRMRWRIDRQLDPADFKRRRYLITRTLALILTIE
jgi:hypothetical protein